MASFASDVAREWKTLGTTVICGKIVLCVRKSKASERWRVDFTMADGHGFPHSVDYFNARDDAMKRYRKVRREAMSS